MTLAAEYGISAWPLLLAAFGETVSYQQPSLPGVNCTVLIRRGGLTLTGLNRNSQPEYAVEIFVSRQDVSSVNVGADTVALLQRVSDSSAKTYTVSKILGQEAGVWHLGLT